MATAVTSPQGGGASTKSWAYRFPPLIALAAGAVLAVWLLPSILNLPQANPTEIAEYAPVPPNNNTAPPGGNLASLGLAGSSSLQQAVAAGSAEGSNGPTVYQSVPQALRCVIINGEAHQTEDPLSPPCVGYYNGNNGGATAPGVTATEIRVILYMEGGDGSASPSTGDNCGYLSTETVARPNDEYFDMDKDSTHSASDPSAPGHYAESQSDYVPELRDLDRYFNQHYQLYGRHVHMLVWFAHRPRESGVACPTASDRQADCNAEFNAFHPFAVIAATWGTASPYVNCMAQHGVVNFLAMNSAIVEPQIGFPSSFYQSYPGYVWSYVPTTEQYAQWEADWLCQKVIHPNGGSAIGTVTNSGSPTLQNKTRVFGFIRSTDPNAPTMNRFGLLVENDIKNCGAQIAAEEQVPVSGYDAGVPPEEDRTADPQYAKQAMLKFQGAGVTTVIWGGGSDTGETSQDADAQGYYPEWFIAGDRHLEGNTNAALQDQKEWMHVAAVTTVERYPDQFSSQCYTAYSDTDPNAQNPGSQYAQIACGFYGDYRLMFTGFQIAGPRLTVANVDEGFHNIPKVELNNPYVPTCFFDSGNYTCIKDMAYEWYNEQAHTPDGQRGCWSMFHDGQRYPEGQFPPGDMFGGSPPEASSSDVCNDYAGG